MGHLLLLRGYSASGKSTYARLLTTEGFAIVSRDIIRTQLTGSDTKTVFDREKEELVAALETAQIETVLRKGGSVVVDSTNLNPKFARAILDLAVKNGATWEVKDFPTDKNVCIAWNRQREDAVPNDIIEAQARRYPMPWPELTPTVQGKTWELYVPDTTLPQAWIYDIDGTLSKLAPGYSPYDPAHYLRDTPNEAVMAALRGCWGSGEFIVLLSGREDTKQGRSDAEAWLAKHDISWDELYMRPEGNKRPDAIVKSELFDMHLRDRYYVRGVYDDRPKVCRMWRARGLPVFQVGDPDKEF